MMLIRVIGAFFGCLGFGIMFNIKGKKLIAASIGGTIGYFVYMLLVLKGIDENWSLFIASTCFAFLGEIFSRKLRAPVTLFIVCALIALVPGGSMYYAMLALIQGNATMAANIGINTLANAGSLALGTIFASTLTTLILKDRRRKQL